MAYTAFKGHLWCHTTNKFVKPMVEELKNHKARQAIAVLQQTLSGLKEDIGEIKKILANDFVHNSKMTVENRQDIKWLKKFFFIIATASIGALAVAIINLIMRVR